MYIKEIHIDSFRHLKDVHLGPFAHPTLQSDVVVLAGPNGGGKSSILELIGYALSNSWSLGWALRRSFSEFSFEVEIGISKDERRLIREFADSNNEKALPQASLDYLNSNSTYFRTFNYHAGKYEKQSGLYEQVHTTVSRVLRDSYARSLGFFLKSDRSYPSKNFDRNRIFSYEESIRPSYVWNMGFNTSEIQYNDMFDFLVQQRYHYLRSLGLYHHRIEKQQQEQLSKPTDPIAVYDSTLQSLFPGYTFADPGEGVPTNLFIKLPSGLTVPFSDLSSGEQETFFILSFFLRHDIKNAVIAIDEPELHLHPELARQLIRMMMSIRPGNQIWLATHNGEIIDEAGRDKVIYVTRNPDTREAVITLGTDESKGNLMLRQLYGYSGYIGIAKNMVFLEGIDSSSDRKMFTRLFPKYGNQIKFIPSRSTGHLDRINTSVLSILADELLWINYYLVRDRDYLTGDLADNLMAKANGRLYVLKRHQIENYMLVDEVIARTQEDVFGKTTTPGRVRNKLTSIARKISAEVARDMIESRLNLLYSPQDFSLGQFMDREAIIDVSGAPIPSAMANLRAHLYAKVAQVNTSLSGATDAKAVDAMVEESVKEVRESLENDDAWRALFPGRRILDEYASSEGLGKQPTFTNSLIKEMASTPDNIPMELLIVVEKIVEGKCLT